MHDVPPRVQLKKQKAVWLKRMHAVPPKVAFGAFQNFILEKWEERRETKETKEIGKRKKNKKNDTLRYNANQNNGGCNLNISQCLQYYTQKTGLHHRLENTFWRRI